MVLGCKVSPLVWSIFIGRTLQEAHFAKILPRRTHSKILLWMRRRKIGPFLKDFGKLYSQLNFSVNVTSQNLSEMRLIPVHTTIYEGRFW